MEGNDAVNGLLYLGIAIYLVYVIYRAHTRDDEDRRKKQHPYEGVEKRKYDRRF